MHWIWWVVFVVAFAAGWLLRQIYGARIIAKLEAEKLALKVEAQDLRDKTAAWVGKATRF
jgi:3-methyladenine DNA glycosylase AlkD